MNDVPAYLEGALSFRPGDLDPPRRAKQLLLRLWNAYWDHQARRATAVMLYALSDRTLADIGVASQRAMKRLSGSIAGPRTAGLSITARLARPG